MSDDRLRRALGAIRNLRSKLEGLEQARSEPIAIIGIGCRFPGGANDATGLWRLLRDGVDAITEVPATRFPIDSFFDPDPEVPGKTYTRWNGYIDGVDLFDAAFFGISPREAESLDPQQRLLLETCWESLENAGQAPGDLTRSPTAVIVGLTLNEYGDLVRCTDPADMHFYHMTGNCLNFAAGRVAYTLGLQGPAMAVDTACSSSLVSVHLACQSLRSRESDLALAGGVSVSVSPDSMILNSKSRMVSPDGRCKTFDARADGFVAGEGCGVVVLKRLSDAVTNGDNVLATIRGSAVNQDGPSGGLTVPNGPAQQALIRAALANAGVESSEVGYLEAHGTGTSLGDPIEVGAIRSVFSQARPPDRPLAIGSVKTNIGHLGAAAGIAGLIKTVLILRHGEIPPHLHLREINPRIPLDGANLVIPTERTPWPSAGGPRIAGVSSFGASGTNAHVVLQEAPEAAPVASIDTPRRHILCLSAKNENALRALARRYEEYLASPDAAPLGDVCFTAHAGRSHFRQRLAVGGASKEEILQSLRGLSAGETTGNAIQGRLSGSARPKVAFLFTGQGAQYSGMGSGLYGTEPTFTETLDRCDRILRPHLNQSLLPVLFESSDPDSALDQTAYTQPCLFALEYALAAMWRSWGIEPSVVMGHSVGEYVAACVAGVFSLEDGLRLIAERGRLMQALPQGGEMAAVFADQASVAAVVARHSDQLSIAAVNGPCNVVVSGHRDALGQALLELKAEGVLSKRLQVSHAFHSPLMDPILNEFRQAAGRVTYGPPQLPLFSNTTGEEAPEDLISNADYWCRHLRGPVQFAASMRRLQEDLHNLFLEVGPGTTLLAMGRQSESDRERTWLPTLRRKRDDWQQVLETVGELYVRGLQPDWAALDGNRPRRRVELPTYAFQRQRYWLDVDFGSRRLPAGLTPEKTGILQTLSDGNTSRLVDDLVRSGGFDEAEEKLLPRVLDGLVQEHRRQLASESPADAYEIQWRQSPRGPSSAVAETSNRTSGRWLILADRGGVGRAMAAQLRLQGHHVLVAVASAAGGDASEADERIDVARADDYSRVLRKVGPLDGVLHLWSLNAEAEELHSSDSLMTAQRTVCGSVLQVIQALAERTDEKATRVWIVTRGAVCAGVNAERPQIAQSPMWGLSRVLAAEHPDNWGAALDLDERSDTEAASALLTEILGHGDEDFVALRGARRHVPRLVRRSAPRASGFRCKADATYLITGGLGALGLRVAEWMTQCGAENVMLVGRTGIGTEDARETVARLEGRGVRIHVAKADVSVLGDLQRLLREAPLSMPPLRGIVHAAGVLDDGILLGQDWQRFARVLDPKVGGAWNLHLISKQTELDFFVLFSSMASLLGPVGQGSYAAANAFLDGLAHYRHHLKLPALSVNWGPWAGSGMAATDQFAETARQSGLELFSPHQALEALGHVMVQPSAQVGLARIDWPQFVSFAGRQGKTPLLREVAPTTPVATAERIQDRSGEMLNRLREADESGRRAIALDLVRSQIAEVLRLAHEEVEDGESFLDVGGDSVSAVQLFRGIERQIGLALSVATIYQAPTPLELAETVLQRLFGETSDTYENLVQVRAEGSRPTLFLIHAIGGGVRNYRHLVRYLGEDQPISGFVARGFDGRDEPLSRIEEIASNYIEELRSCQPDGPYRLGGYSFGAHVAFEMARQLTEQGQAIDLLAIFDQAPTHNERSSRGSIPKHLWGFAANLPYWTADMARKRPRELSSHLRRSLNLRMKKLVAWRNRNGGRAAPIEARHVLSTTGVSEAQEKLMEAEFDAIQNYRPKTYPGKITLFRARRQPLFGSHAPDLGWKGLAAGGVEVHHVSGAHMTILKEPHVSELAAKLEVCLQRAPQP